MQQQQDLEAAREDLQAAAEQLIRLLFPTPHLRLTIYSPLVKAEDFYVSSNGSLTSRVVTISVGANLASDPELDEDLPF